MRVAVPSRMTRWLWSIACVGACAASPSTDVTGPIDATAERFVVDRITIPKTTNEALMLADDLTGDGTKDNQLGQVISALAGQADANSHGADMIAAGRIAASVFVRDDGDHGAVWIVGADGAAPTACLGTFTAGRFESNRTRASTTVGRATVDLPIIADADPATLDVEGLELELAPDGSGGFDATLHGAVRDGIAIAARGLLQMVVANPRDHVPALLLFDTNRDGNITLDEIEANDFVNALLAPDMSLAGTKMLSVGFGMHLAPCPTGSCVPASAATCFDRVHDGDEGGVDCGGSCALRCPGGATCTADPDCESGHCDGGTCREPTCSDGKRDGFEGDVDCGRGCPERCLAGQGCLADEDCATGNCSTCDTSSGLGEMCSGPGTCI